MPARVARFGALAMAVAAFGGASLVGASPEPRAAPGNSATIDCDQAIAGPADPKWRKRSVVAGPLGFYGTARSFNPKWASRTPQGGFVFKVPSIVEGSTPVMARIAPRDAKRAGMTFVGAGGNTIETALAEVRYEPCQNRSPTGYPGGFVLSKLGPVKVIVQVEGESTVHRITVGKRKPR
jgi:hypothetical protein